jgi:hypothetical protein
MNSKNLKGLCEAYSGIYTPQELTEEQVWEEVESWVISLIEEGYDLSDYTWEEMYEAYLEEASDLDMGLGRRVLRNKARTIVPTSSAGTRSTGTRRGAAAGTRSTSASAATSATAKPAAPATTPAAAKLAPTAPTTKPAAPTRPTAASRLAATAAPAPRPAASSPAPRPAASAPAKPTGPAVGKLGSTSFERRTPTSAELKAAQAARAGGASPEKALQAAQKTNLPTTGPTPAIPSAASVSSSMASFKPRDMTKNPLKPTPPTTMKNSYEWGSTSKLVDDIANLYQSVYEAKKIDQDNDGDNDFADVRIARLIASGVSKEEAIRRVKDKSYNEEVEIDEATRMRRELGKEGEIATRKELASRSKAYQRSGSVDRTIATAEREADRTTARNRDETSDDYKNRMQNRSKTLRGLAANRRKSVRSGEGLRGYAAKVEGGDKDLQSARGSARSAGTLTPAEKKGLGEEFELWVNELVEEGYDLSEYTWEDMFDIYEETQLDEATRMRKELGKEGETATRKELARRSNAYQRSGSVDRTIAAAERGAKNPYVAMGKNETEVDYSKRKQEKSKTLTRLASNRRGSVRDKPRAGLIGYAAKVEGGDKDLQSARGSARSAGTLTPAEKKRLGEEFDLWVNALIYEGYDLSEYTWDEMIEIYEETEEERKRNDRRARVAELQAQGRVMTSSKRASQKAAQRKQEKKEEMADRLLRSIQASGSTRSSSTPMGTTEPEEKPEVPTANRKLGGKVKKDDLASQANAILRTIKNENIQLWVNELINEGYDLTGWTSKEITKLYFEIFE